MGTQLMDDKMRTRSTDPSCWPADTAGAQAAVALIAPTVTKQGTALPVAGTPRTTVPAGYLVVGADALSGGVLGTTVNGTPSFEHGASFGVRSTDLPGPVPRGAPV